MELPQGLSNSKRLIFRLANQKRLLTSLLGISFDENTIL